MPRPKTIKPIARPLAIHYRRDDTRECYRVWNNSWFGDMFESLSESQMESLQATCRQFGIPLVECGDDD